jgi:LruC domain-containing protein
MLKYHPLLVSLTAIALGVAAQPSLAIQWSYLSGYDANGVPNNLVDLSQEMPATLLNEIYARLPESRDIRKNDPKLITDDLGASITLLEDAEISVAFIYEGAGYRNSVGYFTYDPAAVPQSPSALNTKIMFPNFSLPQLEFGDAVELGKFKAGTAVGFTIVADGWKGNGVNPNQPASMIFQTLKGLNPEPAGASNLNAHTVLLSKPEDELLVLGFEDLNRTWPSCDHDFNDVLIAIKVTPFSAVDRSEVQSLSQVVKDTDGDGISDDLDAFPLDPERAARRFYPSATGFGYLAFEDNWPSKGDFDMNDVVMAYRAIETLNARNEVTDLKLIYEIRARGGSSNSGFGVHLPGIPRERIKTAQTTLKVGQQTAVALPPETGQTDAVFILSPKVNDLTQTGERWPCAFFNTVNSCVRRAPVPLVAEIHFTQPLSAGQLGNAPYNPFIYRSHTRGREVHLVDHPPTARADPRLFGTGDDASNPAAGRYYRTANDLPWALDVPESWRYPAEWNDIADAYPLIAPWAISGGLDATDWYLEAINEKLVFQP